MSTAPSSPKGSPRNLQNTVTDPSLFNSKNPGSFKDAYPPATGVLSDPFVPLTIPLALQLDVNRDD
jgi:hypothetical protein